MNANEKGNLDNNQVEGQKNTEIVLDCGRKEDIPSSKTLPKDEQINSIGEEACLDNVMNTYSTTVQDEPNSVNEEACVNEVKNTDFSTEQNQETNSVNEVAHVDEINDTEKKEPEPTDHLNGYLEYKNRAVDDDQPQTPVKQPRKSKETGSNIKNIEDTVNSNENKLKKDEEKQMLERLISMVQEKINFAKKKNSETN